MGATAETPFETASTFITGQSQPAVSVPVRCERTQRVASKNVNLARSIYADWERGDFGIALSPRATSGRRLEPGYSSPMSQENVEIVRQMWEAFLGDDPLDALSFCDPEIVWDGTNLPDGRVSHGREAVVEHAARWAEMWDDWEIELEQIVNAGHDKVVLVFRETGRSESGLQMNERHAELYTLREGRIVYRKGFSDPDEALEAAGLSE